VWDIDRQEADAFAADHAGMQVVDGYTDMVSHVDGIILGDHDSCLHYKHLIRPYLAAGVPVFLNRPFALSMTDAHEIIELSRSTGTPIMTGSTLEFAPEAERLQRDLATIGPLLGFVAANSTSDYSTHGIHGLLFIYACLGGGVRTVAYQTADWRQPNGVLTLEYEGRDGERPFFGCIQEISGPLGWIKVFGASGSCEQEIDGGLPLWLPILQRMCHMFQSGQMPQSYAAILEKTAIFLAGFRSAIDRDGAPVGLDELGDWQAPLLNPDRYPEGYFPSS
jgi:predicted dehydrogenase